MKRTFVVQIGHFESAQVRVVCRLKIAAVSIEQALDKAQAKSRAMNRSPEHPAHLKADYLLCAGVFRMVS